MVYVTGMAMLPLPEELERYNTIFGIQFLLMMTSTNESSSSTSTETISNVISQNKGRMFFYQSETLMWFVMNMNNQVPLKNLSRKIL